MTKLQTQLNKNQKCLNDIIPKKGVSNWLKVYPISDQRYDLNKQFWDCFCLHYGKRLMKIQSTCSCRSKVDIQYAMSCKKGWFIMIRHNDLTVNLLTEVCKDVNIEPHRMFPVLNRPRFEICLWFWMCHKFGYTRVLNMPLGVRAANLDVTLKQCPGALF